MNTSTLSIETFSFYSYAKEANIVHENYDIATAMSSSRADPALGHCPGWGYLIIYIRVPALAECI